MRKILRLKAAGVGGRDIAASGGRAGRPSMSTWPGPRPSAWPGPCPSLGRASLDDPKLFPPIELGDDGLDVISRRCDRCARSASIAVVRLSKPSRAGFEPLPR